MTIWAENPSNSVAAIIPGAYYSTAHNGYVQLECEHALSLVGSRFTRYRLGPWFLVTGPTVEAPGNVQVYEVATGQPRPGRIPELAATLRLSGDLPYLTQGT